MWGGGFTETVRFLWEKHRYYSHETYWLPKLHFSQGTLCLWRTKTCWTSWARRRPGWSNPCPVTGTSTLGAAALRSTRASIWKCPLLAGSHFQCNFWNRFISRMRPGVNQCPTAAKRGISLLHGNCQAFTTVIWPMTQLHSDAWFPVDAKEYYALSSSQLDATKIWKDID